MDRRVEGFLAGALGEAGSLAVRRAAARSPELEAALVPRAALAWLAAVGALGGHEGELPGVSGSTASLSKSEAGFSGRVSVGEHEHSFEGASPYRVAAAVVVGLGLDGDRVAVAAREVDLAALGKSLDALAKVTAVSRLAKVRAGAEAPSGMAGAAAPVPPSAPGGASRKKVSVKLPGAGKPPPGLPKPPKPAASQASQAGEAGQVMKGEVVAGKTRRLLIRKSEVSRTCQACGRGQFSGGVFRGCPCVAPLAKSVTSTKLPGGDVALRFGPGHDPEVVVMLAEALGMG